MIIIYVDIGRKMKPTAITFADSKFTLLAQKQKDNFRAFGVKHVTIPIVDQTYGIDLWLHLLDLTIDAINTHGKIFRVDSEIRLLKELPAKWNNGNVLFHIDRPTNVINTGHMILDKSAIPFLNTVKEMTVAMIPPNYTGEKLLFDDEDVTYEAIQKTKIKYVSEIIDYTRSDTSEAACARGNWSTDDTVFVHPFIHNWDVDTHNMGAKELFRNHFRPGASVRIADAAIMGLEQQTTSEIFWKKLGFIPIDNRQFQFEDWIVIPQQSAFKNVNYRSTKFIQPYQL
jgi:hypothetical protein